MLIIIEILVGNAWTVGTSTNVLDNPGAGINISSSTALLTSIAILITNEYISKLKIRYTKLRDCINVNTLLYGKPLKQSTIEKKIDQKEAEEVEKFYNHYLDNGRDIMKKAQFKVEDVFGDIIIKDNFSQEQVTKLILSQNNVNINFSINIILFKPRKE